MYNFLVQQWMGYKAAVAAAGGASTGAAGVGAVEAALMNRALNLLSKILPWAGEKSMGEEPNDFLPVSFFCVLLPRFLGGRGGVLFVFCLVVCLRTFEQKIKKPQMTDGTSPR